MSIHLNIVVGGEAGQGVQTVGFILGKVFAREGFHVFADQDYESRVRGGHNFVRIRVSDSEVGAICENVDILIALNQESLELHRNSLMHEGVAIFDSEKVKSVRGEINHIGLPLEFIALEKAGSKLMANTVAMGVIVGLTGSDIEMLSDMLLEHFGTKAGEGNILAARAGYDYTIENYKGKFKMETEKLNPNKMMYINGNEALALGAIASGCNFMAAYPMTPASSIMEFMAARSKELGLVVVQPEDEISAINMVVGAAFTGARAMTATSGGGFCLMVEGLSLAGMTETPIVVILAQRPGPAIGLPTRTEQGELEFAIHAGHGEFPRAVFAPATIGECFYTMIRAFNMAEKYQIPVIVLTDQHLASSYCTTEEFDLSQIQIDRGELLHDEEVIALKEYKRHKVTKSGISPRVLPSQGNVLVVTDSDEHDEEGHMIENAEIRNQQMSKRLRKLDGLRTEIGGPRIHQVPNAELTLIGWGSTYEAIKEAVVLLENDGIASNILHINEIWPFPSSVISLAIDKATKKVVVENNAMAQIAHLIQQETMIKIDNTILKYDGRPFSPQYIVDRLKKEVI